MDILIENVEKLRITFCNLLRMSRARSEYFVESAVSLYQALQQDLCVQQWQVQARWAD